MIICIMDKRKCMDNITITCESDIVEKVNMIRRQTDYTEDVAREKLIEYENDAIKVIRAFMGIAEKKAPEIRSVNQEIYKQIRYKLNDSMREYNSKQEDKLKTELENM